MFTDRQGLLTFSILLLGLAILSISGTVEGDDDLMDELQKKLDDLEDK